jgi:hypothetical protein
MPRSLEELLRSGMDDATTSVRADDEFVAGMIEHGRTARKHRRQATWIGVAVATVALVAGASLVPLTRSENHGADAPRPHPTSSQYPLDWAKTLPAGPPTDLSYIARGVLHSGDLEIPLPHFKPAPDSLPGWWYGLYGKTRDGWLISVTRYNRQGMPGDRTYGVLTASGSFERLPSVLAKGDAQVEALSPDGGLFADGGALIDVDSRTVVGQLPKNAVYASEWTDAGLLYNGWPNAINRVTNPSYWLWNPGSAPIRLDADLRWEVTTSARTWLTANGCRQLVQLQADGSMTPVHPTCTKHRPLSLSPRGTYLLTQDFSVITTGDGNAEPFAGVPEAVVQRGVVWWEDDDHFIVSAEGTDSTRGSVGDSGGPRHAILVRCSISTYECERAGNKFMLAASDQIDLM